MPKMVYFGKEKKRKRKERKKKNEKRKKLSLTIRYIFCIILTSAI